MHNSIHIVTYGATKSDFTKLPFHTLQLAVRPCQNADNVQHTTSVPNVILAFMSVPTVMVVQVCINHFTIQTVIYYKTRTCAVDENVSLRIS